MKLNAILSNKNKENAFLLGMIYSWPMISINKKYILAYSSYKKGRVSQKLIEEDIESYYKKHIDKLKKFLGNQFDIRLNRDINCKFEKTKLNGVSVIIENERNDINDNLVYGLIEKWLIGVNDNLKRWFIIGFMDSRGSLDIDRNMFSIDLVQQKHVEMIQRKLNLLNEIMGFIYNYNPRILQPNSKKKNDQFRVKLDYFTYNYGFFKPYNIKYYEEKMNVKLEKDEEYIYIDSNNRDVKITSNNKNIKINEFAISIRNMSDEEKLKNIEKYRKNLFDFDTDEEILYSNSNVKEMAKSLSNYRCEIDNSHITFTSKATTNPYVEAHHLIPFSVRDKFDVSIDIVENLVSLCPNCHRKIHLATDKERKDMLNTLLTQRKEKLNTQNIQIEKQELFDFYNISN